ncbi:DUF6968 family protein [Luteimonas huabeiensis]|uniref:DUF6968 family protein n=1 Tax=Luteimonas huabeiensis TaxID=1244513 RepID=UPI001268DCBC|nr:hypothetical protein [Luteimonas huabeiensis]
MHEIKEPIAQRTLKSGDFIITVNIDKPEADELDYRCWYSINIGQRKKISYAIGIDSVQALQLAMKKINADLLAIGKETGAPITWLDEAPGENGFTFR